MGRLNTSILPIDVQAMLAIIRAGICSAAVNLKLGTCTNLQIDHNFILL
jgi:hypothetical protein